MYFSDITLIHHICIQGGLTIIHQSITLWVEVLTFGACHSTSKHTWVGDACKSNTIPLEFNQQKMTLLSTMYSNLLSSTCYIMTNENEFFHVTRHTTTDRVCEFAMALLRWAQVSTCGCLIKLYSILRAYRSTEQTDTTVVQIGDWSFRIFHHSSWYGPM